MMVPLIIATKLHKTARNDSNETISLIKDTQEGNCLNSWEKRTRQQMAQWVKVPATEPDNLSLIPRTHMVGEENQLPGQ